MEDLYKTYSGYYTVAGEEDYMHCSEFEQLIYDSDLLWDKFKIRDINVWYNFAMQGQINEFSKSRHLKMSYVEFLEAIARVAEMVSMAPPTERFRNEYLKHTESDDYLDDVKIQMRRKTKHLDGDEAVEMTEEEWINQELHKKIENILPHLLLYCTKKNFKRRWNWPLKNPKFGLYEKAKKTVTEVMNIMQRGMKKLVLSPDDMKNFYNN